jgi:hypothetical protein
MGKFKVGSEVVFTNVDSVGGGKLRSVNSKSTYTILGFISNCAVIENDWGKEWKYDVSRLASAHIVREEVVDKFKVGDRVFVNHTSMFSSGSYGEVRKISPYIFGGPNLVWVLRDSATTKVYFEASELDLVPPPKAYPKQVWQREDGSVCGTYEEALKPTITNQRLLNITDLGFAYHSKDRHRTILGQVELVTYSDGTFTIEKKEEML